MSSRRLTLHLRRHSSRPDLRDLPSQLTTRLGITPCCGPQPSPTTCLWDAHGPIGGCGFTEAGILGGAQGGMETLSLGATQEDVCVRGN